MQARAAMLALSGATGKLGEFQARANRQMGSGGALIAAAGIRAGTASAQLMRMWNSVEVLGGEMGRGLLPILKGVASAPGVGAGTTRGVSGCSQLTRPLDQSSATNLRWKIVAWFGPPITPSSSATVRSSP